MELKLDSGEASCIPSQLHTITFSAQKLLGLAAENTVFTVNLLNGCGEGQSVP